MAFTAQDVKALREKTGVGMMECKKALVEADVDFLRERGLAAAAKKATRIAAEGVVLPYYDAEAKKGVVVEVNSETDFVAKNEKFMSFVEGVAKTILATNPADVEALKEEKFDGTDRTVTETLNDLVLSIGENMKVRRFERMDGIVSTYIHGGGSVGVMVGFDVADESKAATAEFDAMGKNVAMQIAAMNPKYVAEKDVPADFIEHEKALLLEQAKNDPKNAGKPENILEKMLTGRLKKEMKEICLLDQEYVQGDKESVAQYIQNVAKSINTDVQVKGFVRFETGEGIEKKEENFADEVAKAMN